MIYILFHPDKNFSGYVHGVEFHKGKGTTNSLIDIQFLVKQGNCKAMKLETWKEKEKKAATKKPTTKTKKTKK